MNAIQAWTKATDGKVTRFDNGENERIARDAGRLSREQALADADAPPTYVSAAQDEVVPAQTHEERPSSAVLSSEDITAGAARLALLKEQMIKRQAEDAEMAARILDGGNGPMGMSSHHTSLA